MRYATLQDGVLRINETACQVEQLPEGAKMITPEFESQVNAIVEPDPELIEAIFRALP